MASCGGRPHLQRRVRPGFSPGSLPGQKRNTLPPSLINDVQKALHFYQLCYPNGSKAQVLYHTKYWLSILLGGFGRQRFLSRWHNNDILVYIHVFFGLFV